MRYQKQTAVVSSPLIEHNSSWMLPAPETNTHLTSHLFSFFEHIHSADLHLPKVTRAWFLKRIKAHSMTALEGHSGHFKSHQSYIRQLHDDDLATTRQAVRCHHQKNMFLFACASARFWVFGGRCGGNVAATWRQCGGNVAAMWRQLGGNVAAMRRRCGGDVAAMWRQCGGNAAAMWRRCGGDVAAMWRQCGGDVAAMCRRCGGDVVAMWRRCDGDVVAMWRQCGDAVLTKSRQLS